MLGTHLIKSWSSTQASVSLSSGEAEFYGVVKAGGVILGYQSLLRDVGVELPVRVWTDSTATIGICGRQGLGKLRHIDTQCLWIQQKVRSQSISLYKVRGEENPADLFTKHLVGQERIHNLLRLFGCEYRAGRAGAAPLARAGTTSSKGELLHLKALVRNPVTWDAHIFERALEQPCSSEVLPEAFPAVEGQLPHMHDDLAERFPRAIVCKATLDADPPSHDGLERRGRTEGAETARYTRKPKT